MSIENQFLAKKIPNIHTEQPIEKAALRHKQRTGEAIQKPAEKVGVYLNRLENVFLNEDEKTRLRNIELMKPALYEEFVLHRDEFPESYFDLQKRVHREQGYGDIEIPETDRENMKDVIIEDQERSLDEWVEYLASDDAVYPTWFKYFAFRNIVRLSKFDKEKGIFKNRGKDTTATFPDLNREALAIVCDKYTALANGDTEKFKDDAEFRAYADKKFASLYAIEIQKMLEASLEGKENIRGKWTKYNQGSMEDAELLYESLQGKGTGWCTAGKSTAEAQVQRGDFYVYYTYKDQEEEESTIPSQPRIAIRMQGEKIGEIRGVLQGQSVEPILVDLLDEKLNEFGSEADQYRKKADNMKRLTKVDAKTKSGEELNKDEIRFVYEIDGRIDGFGYGSDPRIKEILAERNANEDLAEILKDLSDEEKTETVVAHPSIFFASPGSLKGVPMHEVEKGLWKTSDQNLIAVHIEYFDPADHERIAFQFAESYPEPMLGRLENFQNVDKEALLNFLISHGRTYSIPEYVKKFAEVGLGEVGERLIREGAKNEVAKNFEKFDGELSVNLLIQSVNPGERAAFIAKHGTVLFPHLSEMEGVDKAEVLEAAMRMNYRSIDDAIVGNIKEFRGVATADFARSLIEEGKTNKDETEGKNQGALKIRRIIDVFKPVPQDVALSLLDEFGPDLLSYGRIRNFDVADHNAILQHILVADPERTRSVLTSFVRLDEFQDLNVETGKMLIANGMMEKIGQFNGAFTLEAERELYEELKQYKKEHPDISIHLAHFRSLREEERVELISKSEAERLYLAQKMGYTPTVIPENMGLQTARVFIRAGYANQVTWQINHFNAEEHDAIAREMIKRKSASYVLNRLEDFKDLSIPTLRGLIPKEKYLSPEKKREQEMIVRMLKAKMKALEPNPVKRFLRRF